MHNSIADEVLAASAPANHSMSPPELMFGYTYHAMMIPPFPLKTLVLGWGEGTIPWLMRKVWGSAVPIHGVDIKAPKEAWTSILLNTENTQTSFIISDAESYVKNCDTVFDYVAVDMYFGNEIPKFVFSPEFVKALRKITGKLLAVNCTFYKWDDFKVYDEHFELDIVKQVNQDRVLFFNPKPNLKVMQ